jgi:hypothetical protein
MSTRSVTALSIRYQLTAALIAMLTGVTLPVLPIAAASCGIGVDADGDGLTCVQESQEWGTDILNPDTDGDGRSDGDEVYIYRSNPRVADPPLTTGRPDGDGDGVADGAEVSSGTDPTA